MDITPIKLLKAYALGIFPMSESKNDPSIFWVEPEERGVIMLDNFHVSKSLKKILKKDIFEIRFNTNFQAVINNCAAPNDKRPDTWINNTIIDLYTQLFDLGFVHSVETWQDNELVGGLYGVSFGSAFFGESMFSKKSKASKVALAHLVARLKHGGYTMLDTQFTTEHLKSMGAVDIKKKDYHKLLEKSLKKILHFSDYDDYSIKNIL
jgi:leucyl/phenylalanyl-tRNA--protein transferase